MNKNKIINLFGFGLKKSKSDKSIVSTTAPIPTHTSTNVKSKVRKGEKQSTIQNHEIELSTDQKHIYKHVKKSASVNDIEISDNNHAGSSDSISVLGDDLDDVDLDNNTPSTNNRKYITNLRIKSERTNNYPPSQQTSANIFDCIFTTNENEIEKPWESPIIAEQPLSKNIHNTTTMPTVTLSTLSTMSSNITNEIEKEIEMLVIHDRQQFVRIGEEILLHSQWAIYEFSQCKDKYRDIIQRDGLNKSISIKNHGVPESLYAIMGIIGRGRRATTRELKEILYPNKIRSTDGTYSSGFIPYYISLILRELLHGDHTSTLFDIMIDYCKEKEIDSENLISFFDMATMDKNKNIVLMNNSSLSKSVSILSMKISNPNILMDILNKFARIDISNAYYILQSCLQNQNIDLYNSLQSKYKDTFNQVDLIHIENAVLESGNIDIISILKSPTIITANRVATLAYAGVSLNEFKLALSFFLESSFKKENYKNTISPLDTGGGNGVESDISIQKQSKVAAHKPDLLMICKGISAGGNMDIINYFIDKILAKCAIKYSNSNSADTKMSNTINQDCILLFLGQLILHRRELYCKRLLRTFPDLSIVLLKRVIRIVAKTISPDGGNTSSKIISENIPLTREDRQIIRMRGVPLYITWDKSRKTALASTLKYVQDYYNKKRTLLDNAVVIANQSSKTFIKTTKKTKSSLSSSSSSKSGKKHKNTVSKSKSFEKKKK